MKNMKKAVIYARQSSGSDDFSESVENQIDNCKKLAKNEKIEIVGIFQDLNTSGKTYPTGAESIADNDVAFNNWFINQTSSKKYRNGLGNVMKQLHDIDYIIVDDMTRLYRPVRGSFLENYINNQLTSNNVAVMQVKGGKIDLNQFDQNLITMLKNAINDEQIANQKKKSMQQLKKRKDNGYLTNGGGKAFGTSYNVMDGSITINDDYIPAIQYMFNAVANYTPYLHIIKKLNQDYQKLVKKCYYYSNLYHVINNPIYCGYMFNSDNELIKNNQITNPCITFNQWQECQKIMNAKKGIPAKAKKNWLPLSGLMYCGCCGAKLVAGTDKGKVYYYDMTAYNYNNATQCRQSRIYMDTLINGIKPLLVMALIQQEEEAKNKKNNQKNINDINANIFNLQQQKNRITELYINGLIDINETEKKVNDLNKKINELKSKLIAINNIEDETTKHLHNVGQKLNAELFLTDEMDKNLFEKLLKKVVTRIDVNGNDVIVDTIYGIVSIPRKNKKLPESKTIINGKNDMNIIINYYTGKQQKTLLQNEKIWIKIG